MSIISYPGIEWIDEGKERKTKEIWEDPFLNEEEIIRNRIYFTEPTFISNQKKKEEKLIYL